MEQQVTEPLPPPRNAPVPTRTPTLQPPRPVVVFVVDDNDDDDDDVVPRHICFVHCAAANEGRAVETGIMVTGRGEGDPSDIACFLIHAPGETYERFRGDVIQTLALWESLGRLLLRIGRFRGLYRLRASELPPSQTEKWLFEGCSWNALCLEDMDSLRCCRRWGRSRDTIKEGVIFQWEIREKVYNEKWRFFVWHFVFEKNYYFEDLREFGSSVLQ